MKIKHEIKLKPEEFLGFSKGFFLRFHYCMFKLQLCVDNAWMLSVSCWDKDLVLPFKV